MSHFWMKQYMKRQLDPVIMRLSSQLLCLKVGPLVLGDVIQDPILENQTP